MQGGVWIYHDYVCMRNGIPVALPVHDVFAENTLDESPGDRVGCDLKTRGKDEKIIPGSPGRPKDRTLL